LRFWFARFAGLGASALVETVAIKMCDCREEDWLLLHGVPTASRNLTQPR
jgi:hypothetical protein